MRLSQLIFGILIFIALIVVFNTMFLDMLSNNDYSLDEINRTKLNRTIQHYDDIKTATVGEQEILQNQTLSEADLELGFDSAIKSGYNAVSNLWSTVNIAKDLVVETTNTAYLNPVLGAIVIVMVVTAILILAISIFVRWPV